MTMKNNIKYALRMQNYWLATVCHEKAGKINVKDKKVMRKMNQNNELMKYNICNEIKTKETAK